jgi:histidine triad (HIT) family protein
MDCIFCQIAAGKALAHIIWEDERHLAFLSNRPNTEGFSVVIPRLHFPSYAFEASDEVLTALTLAARKVWLLLDRKLPDVGRTGLIFEGFGVDHLHAKLFPMHGTPKDGVWRPIVSNVDKHFDKYEGYISSHGGKLVEDSVLAALAARIRS